MPHTTIAYQCDYCRRTFYRNVDALNHERSCKFNPARRSCYTCKHYQEQEYAKICTKWDQPIHEKPYFLECEYETTFAFEGDYISSPIPGTCLHWESRENSTVQAEWKEKKANE